MVFTATAKTGALTASQLESQLYPPFTITAHDVELSESEDRQ